MKKILIVILISLAVISYVFAVNSFFEESQQGDISEVTLVKDCHDVSYIERENIIGTCTRDISVSPCENCTNVTQQENYDCITDVIENEKTKKECHNPKKLIVNKYSIDISDYGCSSSKENGDIIVICDSNKDGNGDGICTPGESCQKFVIHGNEIEKYEKNSRYDYVISDETYKKKRATVEVLE